MFHRVLRAGLFVGLLFAVWAFAHPAFAMPAGLCDDRGASAIAPAPALEAADVAIMRARAPAVCPGERGPIRATIAPAQRLFAPASGNTEHALPIAPVQLAPPTNEELQLIASPTRPLAGIRSRIERPPRG